MQHNYFLSSRPLFERQKDLIELSQLNGVRVGWLNILCSASPDSDLYRFASGEFQRLEVRFNRCFERSINSRELTDPIR